MSEEEFSNESLKKSLNAVGPLYEAIVSEDGEVLDGKHRLEVDPNYPKKQVPAQTKLRKILIRMHAHHRRRVPREETQAMLLELAQELEKTGMPKEDISTELAKLLPYTESWIRQLLPLEYKKQEKVEAAKVGAQLIAQKVEARLTEYPTYRLRGLTCPYCGLGTFDPKEWRGQKVCSRCYDRLERGEISLEPPKPKPKLVEETPKPLIEKRVYEPPKMPGEWRERMQAPVSRMDNWVRDELQRRGISIRSQEPICIKSVVPDVIVEKGDKPICVFLDGPVHVKRALADEENRELLAKRGFRVLELPYDAYTEEQKQLLIAEILAVIE